jgi:hypothetical protein
VLSATTLFVGVSLLVNVADTVPRFDVRPTCRAAIAMLDPNSERTVEGCVKGEETARKNLEKNWSQFPVSDRNQCMATATNHGSPSYEELALCLEMLHDKREQSAKDRAGGRAPRPCRDSISSAIKCE